MRGPSPAAEFAEPVFVRRRNPFRDRKLFLRVPSATHPTGDDGACGPLVRAEQNVSGGENARIDGACSVWWLICVDETGKESWRFKNWA